jgi:hypothetical protein
MTRCDDSRGLLSDGKYLEAKVRDSRPFASTGPAGFEGAIRFYFLRRVNGIEPPAPGSCRVLFPGVGQGLHCNFLV